MNGYAVNFYNVIFPVLVLSSIIVIYTLVVGFAYKTMAKRDVFSFRRIKEAGKEYKTNPIITFLIGVFEYFLIFPIIVILWFSILSVLLFILSDELSVESLLMISIAIVGSTRILSYINEDLAVDVSKLFPLVVLGTLLLEPNFFSLNLLYSRINEIPLLLPKLINFLILPILIEWILRIALTIKELISPNPSE